MKDALVLVVDDVEDNRIILSAWLAQLGCLIEEAADGKDALERALALRPDLIMMDLAMPVMDGLSAIRALRARSETARTFIVAISASEGAAAAALDAGCDLFLEKPIAPERLEEIVHGLRLRVPARRRTGRQCARTRAAG